MILLDSNVLIHYLKGNEKVIVRVQSARPGELFIPSIVAYELEYGTLRATNTRRRLVLSQVLRSVGEVPFDTSAAHEAAKIRWELERAGVAIGPLDLLIAGTAVSRSAILVTNNTTEFGRVATLRVQDWSV